MSSNSQYPTQEEMERRASSEQARQREIMRLEPGPRASRIVLSAPLVRLARSLRKSPDELAAKVSSDTLRRTKFPVVEGTDESGLRTYKEPPRVISGARALIKP